MESLRSFKHVESETVGVSRGGGPLRVRNPVEMRGSFLGLQRHSPPMFWGIASQPHLRSGCFLRAVCPALETSVQFAGVARTSPTSPSCFPRFSLCARPPTTRSGYESRTSWMRPVTSIRQSYSANHCRRPANLHRGANRSVRLYRLTTMKAILLI